MASEADIKKEIRQGILLWMELFASGDVEALYERCYTPDCVLMPPDGPTTLGPDIKILMTNPENKRYVLENDETIVEGNMAVSRDTFTGYRADGTITRTANSLTVWLKKDGVWRMKYDMWTKAK